MTQIKALYLDGQGTKISVNEHENLRIATYTVEVLLKPDGEPDQHWKGIVGKPGRNFNIWLRQDGSIHHCFHTESGDHTAIPDTPVGTIAPNQWNHIAITNDGKIAKTYINGILQTTGQISSPLIVDLTPLYIGCNLDAGTNHFFKGALSEIRIWNTVRTAAEIQANLLTHLTGQEPGLVAYYPLDEGQGTEIHDRTGRGMAGVITGTATWIESEINSLREVPPPLVDSQNIGVLKNQKNDFVLDVLKGEAVSGTMVWGYSSNGSLSQQWQITPQGLIKSQLGELALDLQDIPNVEWAKNVVINGVNGSPTQQWTFTEQGLIVNQSNHFALAMVEKDGFQAVVAYPVTDPKPDETWIMVG
jgi:hypothetical protein